LCCSYFSGEQSKNCDVSIRMYLSYNRIRLSMIFGTDPTSDDACSYEERNGGRRSSRFMDSVRVHYGGGTVQCPVLSSLVYRCKCDTIPRIFDTTRYVESLNDSDPPCVLS